MSIRHGKDKEYTMYLTFDYKQVELDLSYEYDYDYMDALSVTYEVLA